MTFAESIRRRVQAMQPLELFSRDSVSKQGESTLAVAQELSRLHASGQLTRARQGIYFRPKKSRFGERYPSEADVIKFLLFRRGKQTGYLTGARLYNRLGLTTQVSGVIEVASHETRRSGEFLGCRVRFVKAYGAINAKEIPLLEILDAVKDLNQIPGASPQEALPLIARMIQKLSEQDQKRLAQLAQSYPPRVSATLGYLSLQVPALKELA
jgi:hypothetical protein